MNAHEDHRGPAVVPDAFALTDERATAVAGEENAETAAARILQPTWADFKSGFISVKCSGNAAFKFTFWALENYHSR